MKFEELMEAPLPDNWNASALRPEVSSKDRLAYVLSLAKEKGRGSSRVVVETPHNGTMIATKVAINHAGYGQNAVERQLFNDSAIKASRIVVPMIDSDANMPPAWIQTEMCQPVTMRDIEASCGGNLHDLVQYALEMNGEPPVSKGDSSKIDMMSPLARGMNIILSNHVDSLVLGDLVRIENWGRRQTGEIVLIDIGATYEVMLSFYTGRNISKF